MNNNHTGKEMQSSLNFTDFTQITKNIPQWIPLVPIAERIQGRDGRYFIMDSPEAVIERTMSEYAMDLPIDLDHGIETGKNGQAQGWVKEYKVEDGYIYGKVEWTRDGQWHVAEKEYRYISPSFSYEPIEQGSPNGKILHFTSIALTNRPNLKMHALNSASATPPPSQGEPNPMNKKILEVLGLADDATEEQVLAVIEQAKQQKTKEEPKDETPPSQDKPEQPPVNPHPNQAPNNAIHGLVTQAQYDALLKQSIDLQLALNQAQAANQSSIIDDALKAGKITPEQKSHWQLALNSFGKDYVAERLNAMSPIVNATNHAFNNAVVANQGASITEDEAAMAKKMGLTIDEYKQAKEG